MITVVSGILFGTRDGAIPPDWCLFAKRPPGNIRPDLWELPGGKVEAGESHTDALRREWQEELGVNITVDPHVIAVTAFMLEQPIVVSLYEVFVSGSDRRRLEAEGSGDAASAISEQRTRAHTAMLWASPIHAVKMLPCSPGFYQHFAAIDAHMHINKLIGGGLSA